MSNKDVGIYVDLDETLIHGFDNINDGKLPTVASIEGKFHTAFFGNYFIALRPGAKEFLKALHKNYSNVFILTAGGTQFQTAVAESIGILPLVNRLYGRESKDVPKFKVPLLIDDLGIRISLTHKKFWQMGVLSDDELLVSQQNGLSREELIEKEKELSKYYLLVKPFTAQDPNDHELSHILPKVYEKVDIIRKSLEEHKISGKIVNKFTESTIHDTIGK